jgi:recombination protein RecT
MTDFRTELYKETNLASIKNALPLNRKGSLDRVVRIALTEFRMNTSLQKCSQDSIIASLIQACQLGLEIGGTLGQVYLIPYSGKCTIMLGYRGMIELAYRSGLVTSIQPHTVYEKDEFSIEEGTEPKIIHKRNLEDAGAIKGYYVVAKLKEGGTVSKYMSVKEIEKVQKDHSKSANIWEKHYDAMALKTVMRSLFKWLPLSIEMTQAIELETQETDKRFDIDADSFQYNEEDGEIYNSSADKAAAMIN